MSKRRKGISCRAGVGAAGAGLVALLAPAAAQAANPDIVVTSLSDPNDPGKVTLRTAISQANFSSDADRIVFQSNLSGSIQLASTPLPPLIGPTEIAGPGAGTLELRGVSCCATLQNQSSGPATISGLSIASGSEGFRAYGGLNASNIDFHGSPRGIVAISSPGVTVSGSHFSGASSQEGAAIYATGSQLTVVDSVFDHNLSNLDGGAISAAGVPGKPITISGSTFASNRADSDSNGTGVGGAVNITGNGAFTIFNSTFAGNSASNAGAVQVDPTPQPVTIGRSLFLNNKAAENISSSAGALAVTSSGPVVIGSSTFTGNQLVGGSGSRGGGLYLAATSPVNRVTISDSTITGNSGATDGGGIYSTEAVPGALPPVIRNTILFGNGGQAGPDIRNGPGSPVDVAFSLIGTLANSGPVSQTGPNLIGADPQLGALSPNGGATQTLPLPAGSPAIDAGFSANPTDQRGVARIDDNPAVANAAGGNGADIGAYEASTAAPPPVANPKCGGKSATIVATKALTRGTKRNDVIVGRKGSDLIFGLGGNDTICGVGGNDRLYGGKGADRLIGAAGRDNLFGGPGKDRLLGGPGRDKLKGGPGKDQQKQ